MATRTPDAYGDAIADTYRRGWSRVSGDLGNRWFALHTADPGETGASEVTGLNRVALALNSRQTIQITGTPTGGDFTLTVLGDTTPAIAFNASVQDVEDAINALESVINPSGDWTSIGLVNVTGAGALPGNTLTVEFYLAHGQQDITTITGNDAGLTGGTTPTLVFADVVEGMSVFSAYVDENSDLERASDTDELLDMGTASAAETATHGAIWDAETSGNMVASAPLSSSQDYEIGQPVQVAIGGIEIYGAGAS